MLPQNNLCLYVIVGLSGNTQPPCGRARVKTQPGNRYSDVCSYGKARQANGDQNSEGAATSLKTYEYNKAYADDDSIQVNSEMNSSEAIQAFYGNNKK